MPFKQVFDRLYRAHGPQGWWPAETPFEVMVGAMLTQNTAWTNVERAVANLKEADALDPHTIVAVPHERLAAWIRPSGYFNVKAVRLRNYCRWYLEQGGLRRLSALDTGRLREGVLSVNGIGPETADDILLYAFGRPVFVVDAYTRRLFSRLGLIGGDEPYEAVRALLESRLGGEGEGDPAGLFNEYHALIVAHAKAHCRKRSRCDGCCLAPRCPDRPDD